MNKLLCLVLLLAVNVSALAGPCPDVQVVFSPKGGCTDAVVIELARARQSILMQAYSFTSAPIAEALTNAKKRGVKVEAILDKSQRKEKYSELDFLSHSGIRTLVDAEHAIAHNKIIIIDGETVITGSFNFAKAAEERNAENLIVIRDRSIADKYTKNWHSHEKHSEVYEGRK